MKQLYINEFSVSFEGFTIMKIVDSNPAEEIRWSRFSKENYWRLWSILCNIKKVL